MELPPPIDVNEFYFHVISVAVSVGYLIVGLLIKNKIADLELNIEKGRAKLWEHANEIAANLSKHVELDDVKHQNMQDSLDRIEDKVTN